MALLFAIGLFYVRRGSLNATVASALVVGAVNIVLILVLSLLALDHLRAANLTYTNVPFLHGRPFERSVMGLAFGVVLCAYFGHLSVSNCARIVLRRDPSSRSLVWGSVAAQATAIALYSLFVIAVSGAVSPLRLVGQAGRALVPLSDVAGGVVLALGTIFAVLGMGMASVHFSLGLFNIAREWLPAETRRTVVLPRRRARLLLHSPRDGDVRLAVAYLGLEDAEPRFAVDVEVGGRTRRLETGVVRAADLPELGERGMRLDLQVLEADGQRVRARLHTTLRVAYEATWDAGGVGLESLLALSDAEAELVAWVMRSGEAAPAEAEAALGPGTAAVLASLAARGAIVESVRDGERRYRTLRAARRGSRLPQEIWEALADGEEAARSHPRPASAASRSVQHLRAALASERGRAIVGVGPVAAAFLLTEWLLLNGAGSFSGLLSILGVLVVALLAGIFPALLAVAARRRGDYVPGRVYRILGSRPLLGFVYVFSLVAILLHGIVVWTRLEERVSALLVGGVAIALTVVLARRRAFAPRATVELREDEETGEAGVSVVAAGRPVAAAVELEGPHAAPRGVTVTSDWDGARPLQIKVWAHRVAATGDSRPLPGRLRVEVDGKAVERDLSLGPVVVPTSGAPARLELVLEEP